MSPGHHKLLDLLKLPATVQTPAGIPPKHDQAASWNRAAFDHQPSKSIPVQQQEKGLLSCH
jgi:hypothetical protein